jgi:hypothetical protein
LADQLGHVPNFEAMHQIEPMYFYGPDTDPKFLGNFSVRQALNDER